MAPADSKPGEGKGKATVDVYPAWAHSSEDTAVYYGTDGKAGLTDEQVATAREKYGYNELEREPPTPMWKLVLEQFDDTLVKILLLAAAVSFVLTLFEGQHEEEGILAFIEPLVILLILVLNAVVGVWQESNAENALEALKQMQSETAKVYRNGREIPDLPARELVPGDLVELHAGDRVPADMRVYALRTATFRVEQASLTGESVSVVKQAHIKVAKDEDITGKGNMVFSGTAVANGSALCIVNSIGMATEIGVIQRQIQSAAEEDSDTPLKKKLDEFGELLTTMIGLICLLVWLINYKFFFKVHTISYGFIPTSVSIDLSKCTYYFKIAVALAVAAIPEGLPAVITTCLALGTRKMAKKNAIVRKLPSVETLGCTTVICSDKTGTLTTNQMAACHLVVPGDSSDFLREFVVEGSTYDPKEGDIYDLPAKLDPAMEAVAMVCALNNDATVEEKTPGLYAAHGMPTEAALKVLVEKLCRSAMGVADTSRTCLPCCEKLISQYNRVAVLEFDRDRKSMGVLVTTATAANGGVANGSVGIGLPSLPSPQGNMLLVKGAPENVLERCVSIKLEDGSVVPLDSSDRFAILQVVGEMSGRALRCLAFAQKADGLGELATYDGSETHPGTALLQEPKNYPAIESGLTFLGLAGIQDPPRPEVAGAIEECHDAGIRVIVITGDNKLTAEAICKDIGVLAPEQDLSLSSFTGKDFMNLPETKQLEILSTATTGYGGGLVFSRAEPIHKQEIVRLLKSQKEVVAMTGDGVNDAPALKLADIGVAMGISGTEVAKEAADMVLADDNFRTIVSAVSEGRSIYNNMKAFIRYMISSNMGEVASIFITAALGMPEGMIPVQLLWVNLVTDGPPATALGFNPPEKDVMLKPPRRSDDVLITPWVLFRYIVIGSYVGCATVGIFAAWYTQSSFLGIDLSGDGHTPISLSQLFHWNQCPTWEDFQPTNFTAGGETIVLSSPCDYFAGGKVKASTLSLSVLVSIEMFNALNALSEDGSLWTMPPWVNPWLLVAMAVSFGLHFVILYVPFFTRIFHVVPLSFNEWLLVLLFSFPVILIDEVLKFIGRSITAELLRQAQLARGFSRSSTLARTRTLARSKTTKDKAV